MDLKTCTAKRNGTNYHLPLPPGSQQQNAEREEVQGANGSDKETYIYLPHPADRPTQPGDEDRQNLIQWHGEGEVGPKVPSPRPSKFSPLDPRRKPPSHVWRNSTASEQTPSSEEGFVRLCKPPEPSSSKFSDHALTPCPGIDHRRRLGPSQIDRDEKGSSYTSADPGHCQCHGRQVLVGLKHPEHVNPETRGMKKIASVPDSSTESSRRKLPQQDNVRYL